MHGGRAQLTCGRVPSCKREYAEAPLAARSLLLLTGQAHPCGPCPGLAEQHGFDAPQEFLRVVVGRDIGKIIPLILPR
jgi:hypothetical protein